MKINSRFDTLFNRLRTNGLQNTEQTKDKKGKDKKGIFVPFVTLCDPTLERSFDIICTLVENGADALELGLPFSDPLLDGEVIQHANQRALQAGHSTEDSFKLLAKVRAKYPDIPISLLLCANLIFAQGLDNFYQRCADIGIDAVLVADVPILECEPFCQSASKHGVQPVLICPPNADEQTIAQVAEKSQGYVYLVSRAGVTSADNQTQASNLNTLVKQLKANNSAPILQGFGISTPEQVAMAIGNGCAGAISGSAVVRIIESNQNDQQQTLQKLAQFTQTMQQATTKR